jgi:ABC-type transport system involved in multi-copper enzyme maturation permease subunit
MSQLLWKEFREQRYVLLACLTTVAVFAILGQSFHLLNHDEWTSTSLYMLYMLWPLAGLLCGCGIFSTEIGSGTMTFLTSLPVSRGRVWIAKAVSGALILVATVLGTLALWALAATLFGTGPDIPRTSPANDLTTNLLLPFWVYAVALGVSPLVDRPLTSAMITVAACMLIGALTGAAVSHFAELHKVALGGRTVQGVPPQLIPINLIDPVRLADLSGIAFLLASYLTVSRLETLRSVRRFFISGSIVAAWALIAIASLTYSYNGLENHIFNSGGLQ